MVPGLEDYLEKIPPSTMVDGVKYTRLAEMPFQRSNLGLVAAHGGVYAIGGSKQNPAYYNVSFLDLSSTAAAAASAASTSTAPSAGGAAAAHSAGGADASSKARQPPSSPPISAGWKVLAPLNEARCWPMVAAIVGTDGREMVVAAGGVSLVPMFEPMSSVEVYDKDTNTWTLLDTPSNGALPTPVGFGSGAALNATHMLAGGGMGPGTTGTEEYTFSLN